MLLYNLDVSYKLFKHHTLESRNWMLLERKALKKARRWKKRRTLQTWATQTRVALKQIAIGRKASASFMGNSLRGAWVSYHLTLADMRRRRRAHAKAMRMRMGLLYDSRSNHGCYYGYLYWRNRNPPDPDSRWSTLIPYDYDLSQEPNPQI